MTVITSSITAKRRPMAELVSTARTKLGVKADWAVITEDAVWIASVEPDAAHQLAPATGAVTATVKLPGKPLAGLALGFGALWAPLCGELPTLAKIDLGTGRLAATFPVENVIAEGGVTTGAGSVWLMTDHKGTLSRIDPETGEVVQTIGTAPGSYNPLFHKGLIWVTRSDGSSVAMVDPDKGVLLGHLECGPAPHFIAAGGGSVWTLNQGDGSLTRIDPERREVVGTTPLETPGDGGDIAIADGIVWTSVSGVPLSAVDAATGRLLCQWEGPGGDSLIVGHGAIWLIHCQGGDVWRIKLSPVLARCRI